TLFNVLDELILQLPKGTVLFCILDWLSCIEDATCRDDVHFISWSGCVRLQGRLKRMGICSRCCSTMSVGHFRAATLVEKEDVLNVPESVDGDTAGFSKLMWNLKVEEPVAELARKSRRAQEQGTRKEKHNDGAPNHISHDY